MSIAAAVKELSATFTGQLLQPADAGYHDARRVHNGLIDKRPALVACCRGTADVADAVKLARSLKLDIAVRERFPRAMTFVRPGFDGPEAAEGGSR